MTRVLLTGASGFVGGRVLARLLEGEVASTVRCLVHHRGLSISNARIEVQTGDLADPASLAGLCRDVDVVLHLASMVNEDSEPCRRVNAEGTGVLCHGLRSAGSGRMIMLSNAAVYGWAKHRGATEDGVRVAPATPTSRSRADGEAHVRAAGGVIVRPLFVDGEGDRRFLPHLSRALDRSPFWIRGGRARVSAIHVDDLARALVQLALDPQVAGPDRIFHATDQRPVRVREIGEALQQRHDRRTPRWSLPYPVARNLIRWRHPTLLGTSGWNTTAAHRLFLVSHDHWYDSSRLWGRLGWAPRSSLTDRLA